MRGGWASFLPGGEENVMTTPFFKQGKPIMKKKRLSPKWKEGKATPTISYRKEEGDDPCSPIFR